MSRSSSRAGIITVTGPVPAPAPAGARTGIAHRCKAARAISRRTTASQAAAMMMGIVGYPFRAARQRPGRCRSRSPPSNRIIRQMFRPSSRHPPPPPGAAARSDGMHRIAGPAGSTGPGNPSTLGQGISPAAAGRPDRQPPECRHERPLSRSHQHAHLPALRPFRGRDDADRRLPVVLRMQGLRHGAETPAGRLLRVLFLRNGALPADTGGRVLLSLTDATPGCPADRQVR